MCSYGIDVFMSPVVDRLAHSSHLNPRALLYATSHHMSNQRDARINQASKTLDSPWNNSIPFLSSLPRRFTLPSLSALFLLAQMFEAINTKAT